MKPLTSKLIIMKNSLFLTLLFLVAFSPLSSQNSKQIPLIGSLAPSFTALSTNGELTFPNDFGKSWKILFSHPKDFTPVCSSELLELAFLQTELDQLNVKFAVISTDDISQHNMWKAHLEELDYKGRGKQKILFPILEDPLKKASITYGMLHAPTSTSRDIRGVFIIDPENRIRSINFYPIEIGRNIAEIERTIVALQTADRTKMLMPANWNEGDDMMVPHFPYTQLDLANNPDLVKEYYNVGNRMWFKKSGDKITSE
tara:strand:- start:2500 stop:3273 length:774 start_codon:yes stop_codon:yes gene_type:complete